jgi:hypothetical protein
MSFALARSIRSAFHSIWGLLRPNENQETFDTVALLGNPARGTQMKSFMTGL